MPEASTLEVPTVPAVTPPEPADKRTREWKDWNAKYGTGSGPVEPSAPVVKVDVPPPAVVPPCGVVLDPVSFSTQFFLNNPDLFRLTQEQPNPQASAVDICRRSYECYLLSISPTFSAWFRAQNPGIRFLPSPEALMVAYKAALGV